MNQKPNVEVLDSNRIIATACGWKQCNCGDDFWLHNQCCMCGDKIDDYVSDLNAMHRAEMSLSEVSEIKGEKSPRNKYRENLCVICIMRGGPITAPANLRAEAFVKTI